VNQCDPELLDPKNVERREDYQACHPEPPKDAKRRRTVEGPPPNRQTIRGSFVVLRRHLIHCERASANGGFGSLRMTAGWVAGESPRCDPHTP
jgi:hypothetical protein